uniref:Uncharacterized protein n=1 Tax=Acrobeloides nanus TaxID=290746 RepID=A0A914DQT3_9BILA
MSEVEGVEKSVPDLKIHYLRKRQRLSTFEEKETTAENQEDIQRHTHEENGTFEETEDEETFGSEVQILDRIAEEQRKDQILKETIKFLEEGINSTE